MPAASFIDVLVPVPPGADMVARVRQARQLLLDGEIDAALGAARKALEPVRDAAAAARTSARGKSPQQRTLDERFAVMFDDTFSALSGAAHDDEVNKDFDYSREDALVLIATTAALVKRHIAGQA